MILEFSTQLEAQNCLDAINEMAIPFWKDQGYLVNESGVTGKDPQTHINQPNKAKTTSWDEVEESPDATFYFQSLTTTPFEFKRVEGVLVKVIDLLVEAGFSFVEKDFPTEWLQR